MEREPIRAQEQINTPEPERAYKYDAIFIFGNYPYPQRALKEGEESEGRWELNYLSRSTTTVSWSNYQKAREQKMEQGEPSDTPSRPIYELRNVARKVIGKKPPSTHPSGLLYDTRLKTDAAAAMILHGDAPLMVTMLDSIRSWQDKTYAELEEAHARKFLDERKYIKKTKDEAGNVIKEEEAVRKKKPKFEILKEEESYDLYTKIQQASRISEEQGLSRIAIMVDGVHKHRTKKLIKHLAKKGYKLPEYELVTWENILTKPEYTGNRAAAFQRIKNHLYWSPYWQFWRARELGVRWFPPEYINRKSRETRQQRKAA